MVRRLRHAPSAGSDAARHRRCALCLHCLEQGVRVRCEDGQAAVEARPTGVPAINPAARYDQTGKGFVVIPGLLGAHSWYPMSFSPRTGLIYIPVMLNNGPLARGK